MENKPEYKVPKTLLDYILELGAFAILLGVVLYLITYYNSLPEQVPIHFNMAGEADGFGSKKSVIGLLFLHAFLITILYLLSKTPHIFNYPKSLTQENYKQHYILATRMLRMLNLGISLIFAGIFIQIIAYSLNWNFGGNMRIGLLCLLGMGIPMLWYFYQVKKMK